jgi:hypothetical protein
MRAVLVIGLVACGGTKAPALEEKKLPGFSLGLPRGALAESRANTYTAGSVRLELFEHEDKRINIKWQYTDRTEATDMSGREDVLPLAPPGLPGVTTAMAFGGENIYATVFICDHRAVSITTGLAGDAAKTVHTAIVNSVKCTPEPPPPAPVALRALDFSLPATFEPKPLPALAFPMTTWIDDETGTIVSTSVVPDIGIARSYYLPEEIKKQLVGMQDIEVSEPARADAFEWVKYAATTPNGRIHGYASAVLCREVDAFAVTLVMAASDELAAPLHEVVLGGRCRSSLK